MNHGAAIRPIRKGELGNLCEALAALGLFSHLEEHVGRLKVILRLCLLQLALGQVKLYIDSFLKFLLLNEGFLEDFDKVLGHQL